MQKRIQEKNESVFTYFHNKVRLCQPLQLTFKDVKERILTGLWSRELARTLIIKVHTDIYDLLRDIVAIERLNNVRIACGR